MYIWDWVIALSFALIMWVTTGSFDLAAFYFIFTIVLFALVNTANHTMKIKEYLSKDNEE